MRIALISDVHSNLVALEAVLRAARAHRPERIISLGDQVNLGPCPRETLALLKSENVACLHGNHERYILSAMEGHPGYAGANFNTLRFNASLLTPQEITFPKVMELGGVTLCHALPDDDRFPVFDETLALPQLKAMQPEKPMHILCGHGHNPTHIRSGLVTIDSIGAVGCMDNGVPGTAPYVIMTLEDDQVFLRPYYAAYDTSLLPELFVKGGMADFCPIMAHIACLQMMHNQDYLMQFLAVAQPLSRSRGEAVISEQTWKDADAAFAWPDGVDTAAFWKQI